MKKTLLIFLAIACGLCAQSTKVGGSGTTKVGGSGTTKVSPVPAGTPNIIANLWQVFNNATLSTGNLATDTSGGIATGTWTITDAASRLSNSTSGQMTMVSTVNSTTDTGTRGLTILTTGGEDAHVGYQFASDQTTNPLGIGFWVKWDNAPTQESALYLLSMTGGPSNYDNVCKIRLYNDGANVHIGIRGNASTVENSAALSTGTKYWVTLVSQPSASATCKLRVFNSVGVELGSEVTVTPGSTASQLFLDIGLVGTYAAGTGNVYVDNLVVSTSGTYPLGP